MLGLIKCDGSEMKEAGMISYVDSYVTTYVGKPEKNHGVLEPGHPTSMVT
jgi:hypothetical protein